MRMGALIRAIAGGNERILGPPGTSVGTEAKIVDILQGLYGEEWPTAYIRALRASREPLPEIFEDFPRLIPEHLERRVYLEFGPPIHSGIPRRIQGRWYPNWWPSDAPVGRKPIAGTIWVAADQPLEKAELWGTVGHETAHALTNTPFGYAFVPATEWQKRVRRPAGWESVPVWKSPAEFDAYIKGWQHYRGLNRVDLSELLRETDPAFRWLGMQLRAMTPKGMTLEQWLRAVQERINMLPAILPLAVALGMMARREET